MEASKLDTAFGYGFATGLALGLTVALCVGVGISDSSKKNMVDRGLAEYRINAKTGQSSFHMFTVESGKVVN